MSCPPRPRVHVDRIQLCLVTGASSGLGMHFAKTLANHGAKVRKLQHYFPLGRLRRRQYSSTKVFYSVAVCTHFHKHATSACGSLTTPSWGSRGPYCCVLLLQTPMKLLLSASSPSRAGVALLCNVQVLSVPMRPKAPKREGAINIHTNVFLRLRAPRKAYYLAFSACQHLHVFIFRPLAVAGSSRWPCPS